MLIDSNKLKEHYSWWSDNENKKLFDDIIDRQPEAVVYCADCKYCNVVTENEWLDARCTWYRDKSIRPPVELTHFCRRGERRTNEID